MLCSVFLCLAEIKFFYIGGDLVGENNEGVPASVLR
jgi:hypothetical protein